MSHLFNVAPQGLLALLVNYSLLLLVGSVGFTACNQSTVKSQPSRVISKPPIKLEANGLVKIDFESKKRLLQEGKLLPVTEETQAACQSFLLHGHVVHCTLEPIETLLTPLPAQPAELEPFIWTDTLAKQWTFTQWNQNALYPALEYKPRAANQLNLKPTSRLATWVLAAQDKEPIDYAKSLLQGLHEKQLAPQTKLLRKQSNDVIFEYHVDAPDSNAQYVIVRVLKAKQHLYVAQFTSPQKRFPSVDKTEWLNLLGSLRLKSF